MSTRKMPIGGEENAKKRQRVEGVTNAFESAAATFDDLNTDCLVNILSYLPRDDMDSVAVCSRACREARNNESLDQTRTGVIRCSEFSTIDSINNAIIAGRWNADFLCNRTYLKIIGVERIPRHFVITDEEDSADAELMTGVTHVDLSLPECQAYEINDHFVCALLRMCPNAVDIDLSNMEVPIYTGVCNVMNACTRAARLTWNGCKGLSITGFGLNTQSTSTTRELNLNDSFIETTFGMDETIAMYGNTHTPVYMLQDWPNIERLSIKNATLRRNWPHCYVIDEALPQKIIVKFVRRCPTLRWLCSDLTEENVAMLKQERPDVTFVSE